eukprot:CAMPEP_0119318662 /NCGR_PEP_ID=MMETSP1333-20130426/47096_1 /TAXON_ID=418940 /ORGANISM="Scyphosphaera apsteinii, Strain RCC1455" /LENGTH=161 /DNA_ID=CAMNT_0007324893 /DNA_START=223 /DNA_END=709 /DNA_ORIENTATION=-
MAVLLDCVWVVHAAGAFVDAVFLELLGANLYLLKLAILVYMAMRNAQGAKTVYSQAVAPFLLRHEAQIDDGLEFTRQQASKKGLEAKDMALQLISRKSHDILKLIGMLVASIPQETSPTAQAKPAVQETDTGSQGAKSALDEGDTAPSIAGDVDAEATRSC